MPVVCIQVCFIYITSPLKVKKLQTMTSSYVNCIASERYFYACTALNKCAEFRKNSVSFFPQKFFFFFLTSSSTYYFSLPKKLLVRLSLFLFICFEVWGIGYYRQREQNNQSNIYLHNRDFSSSCRKI